MVPPGFKLITKLYQNSDNNYPNIGNAWWTRPGGRGEMVEPGQQLSLELQIAEEISRICEISEADIRIVNVDL
jgi:hypothetical protein